MRLTSTLPDGARTVASRERPQNRRRGRVGPPPSSLRATRCLDRQRAHRPPPTGPEQDLCRSGSRLQAYDERVMVHRLLESPNERLDALALGQHLGLGRQEIAAMVDEVRARLSASCRRAGRMVAVKPEPALVAWQRQAPRAKSGSESVFVAQTLISRTARRCGP